MAQLATVLDRVHDEFPAVPEPVALRALSDSFKEFCKRTHIWQELLPTVRLIADRTQFELFPDDGLIVVALKEVRLNGERIPPVVSHLPRILTNTLPSAAKPAAFVQLRPDLIELVNATSTDQDVKALAAITLKQGFVDYDVPDVILDEYAEAIAAGAKGRLIQQANQPWYAPDAAPAYLRPYYRAINEAKVRAMTALGEVDLAVAMRSW